jgi:hypothetical protein
MCKEYKNYENLEGKVAKAIKKSVGLKKGFSVAAAMIAVDIWNTAKDELRSPNDQDISRGIYEFLGATR